MLSAYGYVQTQEPQRYYLNMINTLPLPLTPGSTGEHSSTCPHRPLAAGRAALKPALSSPDAGLELMTSFKPTEINPKTTSGGLQHHDLIPLPQMLLGNLQKARLRRRRSATRHYSNHTFPIATPPSLWRPNCPSRNPIVTIATTVPLTQPHYQQSNPTAT